MTAHATAIVVLVLHVAGEAPQGADPESVPASAARHEAANAALALQKRWHLRLLPEKYPEVDPALLGSLWSERMLRDILGRGTDHFISFAAPRELQGGRTIELKTVRHNSVNARVPATTTSAMYPLTLGGPFLEYDGLLHTAYVNKDVFVPDAILEVADRKWYTAEARRTERTKEEDAEVTVTEYLLEFDDDPIEAARGTLTFHRHVRKLNEAEGKMTRFSAIFVRFRHARDERAPYELQIGTPEQRSLTAWFYAGKPYALLREQMTVWTGIYRRETGD